MIYLDDQRRFEIDYISLLVIIHLIDWRYRGRGFKLCNLRPFHYVMSRKIICFNINIYKRSYAICSNFGNLKAHNILWFRAICLTDIPNETITNRYRCVKLNIPSYYLNRFYIICLFNGLFILEFVILYNCIF